MEEEYKVEEGGFMRTSYLVQQVDQDVIDIDDNIRGPIPVHGQSEIIRES